VVFARFELMRPYFVMTSYDIKDKYQIVAFPTVLMFVNGQEVHRWAMVYDLNDYRMNIDAVLARTRQPANAAAMPARPEQQSPDRCPCNVP
jgi:thioredoxin-like negative regulator of GroEL